MAPSENAPPEHLRRRRAAHERASAAHERAAETHDAAATFFDDREMPEPAARHQQAAEADRAEARREREIAEDRHDDSGTSDA